MNRTKHTAGFTLVELAVVIVIIGLIIGAVIKGQELIDNARLNSIVTQVDSFKSAVTGFRDKYGALPGDFSQAQARIPGCQAAGANCANGNGDGSVGTVVGANVAAQAEGRMAWQHLAFGNFITGVVPGADAAAAVYNQNFPGARVGGGYVLVNSSIGTPALQTLWLRLQATQGSAAPGNGSNEGALTPSQAAIIDRKIDDGNPFTGTVRATGVAANCNVAGGSYNETVSTKDCNLFFQMQ